MMRSSILRLMLATLVAVSAAPAVAQTSLVDGDAPGLQRGEKIEPVLDLPDVPALNRAGGFFDLGYLYRDNTAMSDHHEGFVLYAGPFFMPLEGERLTKVTDTLGADPTLGQRELLKGASSAFGNPWKPERKFAVATAFAASTASRERSLPRESAEPQIASSQQSRGRIGIWAGLLVCLAALGLILKKLFSV